mmetsp:Transcript_26985/g.23824  ORF Transcript_26985/g.23824 Transcript_26985/m.23824 type:complete len:115 (+) Transcript_26985:69-413(+)
MINLKRNKIIKDFMAKQLMQKGFKEILAGKIKFRNGRGKINIKDDMNSTQLSRGIKAEKIIQKMSSSQYIRKSSSSIKYRRNYKYLKNTNRTNLSQASNFGKYSPKSKLKFSKT